MSLRKEAELDAEGLANGGTYTVEQRPNPDIAR